MAKRSERYFLGLAGVSSADRVEAALLAVAGEGRELRARQVRHETIGVAPELRAALVEAAKGESVTPPALHRLDRAWGECFAAAAAKLLSKSRIGAGRLSAVGQGGQTAVFDPTPEDRLDATEPGLIHTLCLGSPACVAQRLGVPVVADFAQADRAAGGRGEPIEAWGEWALLHDARKARVVLHLGGVARLTFLPAGGLPADTVSYDLGPGLAICDELTRRLFEQPFDADGSIAATGKPEEALLNQLLAHRYFHQPPPKTTHRGAWNRLYLERLLLAARNQRISPPDLVATACELTVRLVERGIADLTQNPHEVILAGGGAKNIHLAMRLRQRLSPASTISAERLDFDATAWRAACYAILAAARLDRTAANVAQSTGADKAVVLGSLTEA